METLIFISNIIIFIALIILIIFLKNYFPSYFSAKGKNLATKEDITEITDKIESVKNEYAERLASTEAELSSQINTSGFRYEKEFEILDELTALLVDVRDASLSLRPMLDIVDSSKTNEEIKKERLSKYYTVLRALYLVREKKRPFYPDDIYEALQQVEKSSHSESIKYQYSDSITNYDVNKYWETAEKNQKIITNDANRAMQLIRDRITKWELIINQH
jgi:hypothetical protein